MNDTTSELRQQLEIWEQRHESGYAGLDDLEAIIVAQRQQWEAAARIAVYREIEANWHHNDVKKYIVDLHENDLKRLDDLNSDPGKEQ